MKAIKSTTEHAWVWDALKALKTDLLKSSLLPATWDWNALHQHYGTPLMAVVNECLRMGKHNDESSPVWGFIRLALAQGADPRVTAPDAVGHSCVWGREGDSVFPLLPKVDHKGHCAISLTIGIEKACLQHEKNYAPQITNAAMLLKVFCDFKPKTQPMISIPEGTVNVWESLLMDHECSDVKLSIKPTEKEECENDINDGDDTIEAFAHSIVLMQASPVLRAMLSSTMVEGTAKVIRVDSTSKEAVELLLRLLYTGTIREAPPPVSVLLGTLDLAHRWQVIEVVTATESHLVSRLAADNLVAVCEAAVLKNLTVLRRACHSFAQGNQEIQEAHRSYRLPPVVAQEIFGGVGETVDAPAKKRCRAL